MELKELTKSIGAMKKFSHYNPPFLLKFVLLICLIVVGTAHRRKQIQRAQFHVDKVETLRGPLASGFDRF